MVLDKQTIRIVLNDGNEHFAAWSQEKHPHKMQHKMKINKHVLKSFLH